MRFQTAAEIEDLLRRFEDCTYPVDGFHHAEHIAVAAWYLLANDEAAALALFRKSLISFAESLDAAENYHETITTFWIKVVAAFLATTNGDRLSRVNAAVARFDDKTLIDRHYSKELLDSPAARATWIEPDRLPLSEIV
jgi:hypothetical protein